MRARRHSIHSAAGAGGAGRARANSLSVAMHEADNAAATPAVIAARAASDPEAMDHDRNSHDVSDVNGRAGGRVSGWVGERVGG